MRERNRFHVLRGIKRRRKSHPERGHGGWRRYLPLWAGAVTVGLGAGATLAFWPGQATSQETGAGISASFGSCHVGGGHNCVVDGDTLWVEGVKVRVADVDAPETHGYKCASEKALGDRATARLRQLVNSGTVTLAPIDRDEDRYRRKLRIVMVDGESVGESLVGEGLARRYEGGRKPWC